MTPEDGANVAPKRVELSVKELFYITCVIDSW